MKKIFLFIALFVFSVSLSAGAAGITVESFEQDDPVAAWSGSSSVKNALVQNIDSTYIKDGESSLKVVYPVSSNGSKFSLIHKNYKNGGLAIPSDESMIVTKIGIWVYMPEADDNIKMYVKTKNPRSTAVVSSDSVLLNFVGWKYLTFDIDSTSTYLYSIQIERVEKQENTAEKYIYLDAVEAVYEYDPQYKVDLKTETDIKDGAERIAPDIKKIVCTFTTPIATEENLFTASFTPAVDCEIKKTSDPCVFEIQLNENLQTNTEYTLTLSGITDVYGQMDEYTMHFSTKSFHLDITKIKNNGSSVTDISDISSGTLELSYEMQSYDTATDGSEVWLFCGVTDENGKMTGLKVKKVTLSNAEKNDTISFDVSGGADKIQLFVLKSLTERSITECVERS